MLVGGDPMQALDRLLDATRRGEIDRVCALRSVDLLGVFGSAVRRLHDPGAPAPKDLDVAVQFAGDDRPLLELLNDLMNFTDYEGIDLAVLNHGSPEIRAAGLTGLGLYESTSGAWATAQMAALGELYDTRHLRLLDLEVLAA